MQSSQYHGEKEMYFFLRLEFMFSLSLSHSASPRMKPTDFGQRSTSKLNSETAHTAQIVEYVFLWFKSIWIEIGLKQYGILSLTIELCARALVCVCVCVSLRVTVSARKMKEIVETIIDHSPHFGRTIYTCFFYYHFCFIVIAFLYFNFLLIVQLKQVDHLPIWYALPLAMCTPRRCVQMNSQFVVIGIGMSQVALPHIQLQ